MRQRAVVPLSDLPRAEAATDADLLSSIASDSRLIRLRDLSQDAMIGHAE
jgi:hypothetical protein